MKHQLMSGCQIFLLLKGQICPMSHFLLYIMVKLKSHFCVSCLYCLCLSWPVCSWHGKVTVFSMESGVFGKSDLAAVSERILLFNKRSVGTLSTMSRKINHVEQSQPETKTNLKWLHDSLWSSCLVLVGAAQCYSMIGQSALRGRLQRFIENFA